MMHGKLIVFEGTDSSGKKTQATLLEKRLKKEGKLVEMMSFPTYHKTKIGDLVGRYLAGEFGTKEEVGPEIGSLIFMMDRYQFKEIIKRKLESGITIIMDRYTTSNIFQAAEAEGKEQFKLWKWIKAAESRLPQADIVIFLNVSPDVSEKLFTKRESRNIYIKKNDKDILEKDRTYQEKVRRLYLGIAKKEGWIIINCCRNNMLRKPEDIHEEIYKKLKKRGAI